jgi:acyl carrier protein
MASDELCAQITRFIRDRFLDGDPAGELDERAPLLEWGVINSLNVAVLLGFIRAELGVVIPPVEISSRNFRDVRSIAALVGQLRQRLLVADD